VNNVSLPRQPQRPDAAVKAVVLARERCFPRWQRIGSAAIMAGGLTLMLASTARPAAADVLYMSGFTMVLLDLLTVAWVLVHLPARAAHALCRSPAPRHENP
jgi:hypothetical protein